MSLSVLQPPLPLQSRPLIPAITVSPSPTVTSVLKVTLPTRPPTIPVSFVTTAPVLKTPSEFVTDDDEFVYPLLELTGKIGKILPMKDVRNYVDKKLAEKHEQYLIGGLFFVPFCFPTPNFAVLEMR